MADRSIQHPLDTLSPEDDLSVVLETEDPALMSIQRFEEVIAETHAPILRAYLFGLFDQRRIAIYCGSR